MTRSQIRSIEFDINSPYLQMCAEKYFNQGACIHLPVRGREKLYFRDVCSLLHFGEEVMTWRCTKITFAISHVLLAISKRALMIICKGRYLLEEIPVR